MKDLIQELERVLRGKDQPNTKKKRYEEDEEELYDDDDSIEDSKEDNEDDEFSFKSESEREKRDPSYKQDVGLIRSMLASKLKERFNELRGKKK